MPKMLGVPRGPNDGRDSDPLLRPVQVNVKMPRAILKALNVYCALEERRQSAIVCVALKQYLEQVGNEMVKACLRDA